MKKLIIFLSVALFVAISAFNTRTIKPGIQGVIEPQDGAKKVWAIMMGEDSLSAIPVSGKFSIEAKPGTWTLIIEAIKPYKDTVVNNILVLETNATDVGVIKLQKE
jgi:hypothetical protein